MDQPGVYAIIHVLSGTRYIGQTTSLDRRWAQHREALEAGVHHNSRLQKMWTGDSAAAFEFKVLEQGPAYLDGLPLQEWLASREDYYIETHKVTGRAFNIVDAELVETAASRRVVVVEQPNQRIHDELASLKPQITEAEARVRRLQVEADKRAVEAVRLQAAAVPKLFGFLKMLSSAEQLRVDAAREASAKAKAAEAAATTELRQANAALAALLEQRRIAYQSFPGNQKRAMARKRGRSMF